MYRTFEATLRVAAPPATVFPLLCPVREHDWVDGWAATVVHSVSGLAETGCVFTTGDLVWVVHAHVPPRHVGFTIVAADRFAELLTIDVTATDGGCALHWRRAITALTAAGAIDVEHRLAGWPDSHGYLERALGHHLATGGRLPR
jgi:hypothetical protein